MAEFEDQNKATEESFEDFEAEEQIPLTPEEIKRQEELDALKQWYVLHTYSGYEDKVKENIELRSESMGMQDNIFRVFVPEEEYTVEKDGEKKTKKRKIFPGYVIVEMIMSDDAWFVVRNTPNVTGFVGSHGAGSKPSPLLAEEVERMFQFEEGTLSTRARDIDLDIGERVFISGGAFEGMEGAVEAIEPEKGKVHVTLELFGRETSTEVDYDQISKIYNQ